MEDANVGTPRDGMPIVVGERIGRKHKDVRGGVVAARVDKCLAVVAQNGWNRRGRVCIEG